MKVERKAFLCGIEIPPELGDKMQSDVALGRQLAGLYCSVAGVSH